MGLNLSFICTALLIVIIRPSDIVSSRLFTNINISCTKEVCLRPNLESARQMQLQRIALQPTLKVIAFCMKAAKYSGRENKGLNFRNI